MKVKKVLCALYTGFKQRLSYCTQGLLILHDHNLLQIYFDVSLI